jgi:hypothetical protein
MTDVRKNILKSICKLERFNISQPVLDMRVNDQFNHSQDFSAQMERVTESTLLAFLCRQGLNWLQIEVVIQVQVVQVFAVN